MNYLAYILVALMPFVITDKLWDYSNLPKTLWIQNGVILLAVLFFWTRRLKDITVSRTLIAYMVFLLWAGLSIFWATNKHEAVVIFSHWAVCGLFLFLVQNMNINKTLMFAILVFTAWIVALIGLGQHFFHLDWVLQSSSPAATFANKNLTNAYILMIMPLGVASMVSVYQLMRGRSRVFWTEMVCFALLCIAMATMLTFIYIVSRRTAVVVILILGTYYLMKYLRRLDYAVVAFLIIGLFMAGYFYMRPYFVHTSHRIELWQNTAEIIKKHPIVGVGVGNFRVHYDKYAGLGLNVNEVHNDYLQLLCELGIVGLYLAFLTVAYAYRGAWKKRDLHSTALKAGLAVFLIIALFNFPMQKAVMPFMSALYLGMLRV